MRLMLARSVAGTVGKALLWERATAGQWLSRKFWDGWNDRQYLWLYGRPT